MNNTIYGGTTATPTPITLVDQTYNPKSENAQSGIAVAEAIVGVEDTANIARGEAGEALERVGVLEPIVADNTQRIGVVESRTVPKNYELIATIKVTPDENGNLPTSIVFSKDSNGNEFNLTDFYVRAVLGATDGTAARASVYVNSNGVFGGYSFGSTLSSTSLRNWYLQWINLGENNGALCVTINSTSANTSFPTSPNVNASGFNGGLVLPSFTEYFPVKSFEIKLTGGTNKTFISGSKFELWGVRK